jgi:hypothetical protein
MSSTVLHRTESIVMTDFNLTSNDYDDLDISSDLSLIKDETSKRTNFNMTKHAVDQYFHLDLTSTQVKIIVMIVIMISGIMFIIAICRFRFVHCQVSHCCRSIESHDKDDEKEKNRYDVK